MAFGLMPFTRANVAALKAAVRVEYPQIKSSHVDEAIAFGFGFDTYAAMLPVLELADASSCMTAQITPDWFALRLKQLGYDPFSFRTVQHRIWAPPVLEPKPAFKMRTAAAKELFKPRPANDV